MALNNAHTDKGVLIYTGEVIILYCDHVTIDLSGSLPTEMKGNRTGRAYLTTHRIIFNNKERKDRLQSLAAPFFCLKQVELEQPVFGANYLKGYIKGQPDGGFTGETKFKMTFKHGGAIEFGQALLKVASMATRNINQQWREAPPPYTPPGTPWAAAPPPAYAPPQAGYYGWMPPTNTFPDRPPANGVYMYEAPPPYPGLAPYPPTAGANGYAPPAGFAAPAPNAMPPQANQSAYYDPQCPQYAYVPPPAYTPTAPSYDGSFKQKSA